MQTDSWKKTSYEQMIVSFDCSNLIATGDTISTAAVTIYDQDEVDVSSTMVNGTASIDGTTVTQSIKAGTDGQNYLAKLKLVTAAGDNLEDTLNIRVRDDTAERFRGDRPTLGEFKRLMRLETDDHDDILDILIPSIKEFVMEYCHDTFKVSGVNITTNTIAFVASSPPTITDSESNFLEEYFSSGIEIIVENSFNNDKLFYVPTAVAGTLTLDAKDEVIAEAAGNSTISITRVRFPKGLKAVMATMLSHLLKSMAFDDSKKEVSGETIGDYTVRYRTVDSDDFPKALLTMLNAYRKVGLR